MTGRYDLVVLGGGTAGLIASQVAAGLGARVALVERARQPGGDCLFTGCVPSKALLASARRAHEMRTADRLGLERAEPRFRFERIMERVGSVIEQAGRPDTAEALSAKGVEVVRASGAFTAPGRVAAGGRELRYRAAVIATGSRPTLPPLPGLAEAQPLTNETVFGLRRLPGRLTVLGGGPVGVELAQAFARLGSEVTIFEEAPTLLPREDPEAGRFIASTLSEEGVAVHTASRVVRVEPNGGGAGSVTVDHGRERHVGHDRLLVGVGRAPVVEGLGLDAVSVEVTQAGAIRVDDRLRTTGDRIYAAGDVIGQLYFTHVAGYHGLVAAANALFRARRTVDHSSVPWVTFTDPEVARVGLTEAQARERLAADPLVFRYDYADSDRALTAGEARGFAKLVSDRRGRLLGATLAGPAAGESIAEAARLVAERRRVADLSQAVHAYPTFTEAPARAADGWWRRRYMTPGARRLLRPVLAALRAVDHPRG